MASNVDQQSPRWLGLMMLIAMAKRYSQPCPQVPEIP
jgi:hypothetical protein